MELPCSRSEREIKRAGKTDSWRGFFCFFFYSGAWLLWEHQSTLWHTAVPLIFNTLPQWKTKVLHFIFTVCYYSNYSWKLLLVSLISYVGLCTFLGCVTQPWKLDVRVPHLPKTGRKCNYQCKYLDCGKEEECVSGWCSGKLEERASWLKKHMKFSVSMLFSASCRLWTFEWLVTLWKNPKVNTGNS